jgi:metal-dependent HD superfamily phosphatase/phosphodiesterase
VRDNPLLAKVLELVNANLEVQTLWKVVNVHAVSRLAMTDHGPIHFQIVANNALKILRLFEKAGVKPSIVTDFKLTQDHAEVVVLLASLFHDIGMSIHRRGHEEFSVVLSNRLLHEILEFLPVEERTILISEVLHAIISHRRDGQPLTIEAGVVRVADALDMTKGRTRLPYRAEKLDIHSVSALAVDEIEIKEGKKLPVDVSIVMNHTAGIFQVDDLLKEKVRGSGIEQYLNINIYIDKGEGRMLFEDFYNRNKPKRLRD